MPIDINVSFPKNVAAFIPTSCVTRIASDKRGVVSMPSKDTPRVHHFLSMSSDGSDQNSKSDAQSNNDKDEKKNSIITDSEILS